jgi:glycopeptide antibiotics resistance protein
MLINKWKSAFVLFFIYFVLLIVVSFLGIDWYTLRMTYYDGVNHNLVPFKTLTGYILGLDHYNFDTWFYNTFGVVILFMPLGFLLPKAFLDVKTLKSVFCFSLLLSSFIEVMQFATKLGVLDIDDVFLNVIGAAFGYLILRFITQEKTRVK